MIGTHSCFDYDPYGILVRKTELYGALQRIVPERLSRGLLLLSHYSVLAGHPGTILVYYTVRKKYYWPQVTNDVMSPLRIFQDCIRLQETYFKHRKLKKLFLVAGTFNFVAMSLRGPLKPIVWKNIFILFN